MSLYNTMRRFFGFGPLSNPDTGSQLSGSTRISTASGESVSDERALKISAVWACVQLISNSVAGLPLNIYQDAKGERKPITGRDSLDDILRRRPNPYMKPRDFRSAMTVQMCLWSNAYAEILRVGNRAVGVMPLRPGRMTPVIGDDGVLTYHYTTEKGVKVYAQDSILHLKGFGTDGFVGVERGSFAREAYGLTVAAETFAAKQFSNGGRPGGVLTFDTFLKPDQREQAKKLYEGMAEGAMNANKLWVLEGGSKYLALDFAADQMQMIATRSQQLSEVARFFGVPGVMIGAGDSTSAAWPASFEQQMLSFLTFTLQAYLDEWKAAIEFSLIPANSDVRVDHDTAPLVKMDSNATATYLSRLVQNGLMTRNEGRLKLGLPRADDEGADALTMQTNLNSLEGADNAQEISKPVNRMPTEVRQ
jgi:HK97 family phage portal protein